MITEYPYDWRAISDDHNDLIKQLQDAARTGQIVLLIVDAWTAPLQRYHDFLQAFDTSVPFNHAVLVPWNEDDEQTQACRDRLKAQLHLLFRSKYPGGQASPRFRSDIRSVEEFRSALLSALEMIRSEIETHRAAQLQIRDNRSPKSALRASSPMPADAGGRIITFYSYKGGTGRTMALANAAWIVASAGAVC
jgi:FxsC-like protein